MGGGIAAAFVSFLVQTTVYFIQKVRNVPFVNPEWVETIQPILAKIPYLGAYLIMLSPDVTAWILSFIVLWIVFWTILSMFKGSAGYIAAFLVGILIIYIWIGGVKLPSIPPPPTGG